MTIYATKSQINDSHEDGTPTKRQVSKRQVSKRLVSKRLVSKLSKLQYSQFLNFIYL
jgi:hypothetical protein